MTGQADGVATLLRHRATHALVAFLGMGGWAVFANRLHPVPEPLIAGLAQGAVSATITLLLKRAIEAIAVRMKDLAALVLPPLACFAVSLALLLLIHTSVGTPEISATIAVPLAVSTGYGALYNLVLWRGRTD